MTALTKRLKEKTPPYQEFFKDGWWKCVHIPEPGFTFSSENVPPEENKCPTCNRSKSKSE